MDNKSDNQLHIIQGTIEANRQDYDEKTNKLTEYLTTIITSMMDQIKKIQSLPDKNDSPKYLDPTTVVPVNNRYPSLEDRHSTKIGVLWTLKHEIS